MGSALASRAPPPADPPRGLADPLPVVRDTVRDILLATPAFAELAPEQRRELAGAMVKVCYAAASLIREEIEGDAALPAPPLARAQEAEGDFGGAAKRVAGTTRAILNAVSFPTFVTDLINGVFKSMIDSTQTQMQSYVELLNSVAATTDGFADSNMGPARARAWLVDHYPDSFEFETSIDDEDVSELSPEERAELEEERAEIKVRARPGGKPPTEAALRADLGIDANESVSASGDPESSLVPLVRRRLAKMRQEMLATLVQMGMQRIVIDSGRITASMRFHIDTRDALARDSASRFGTEHEIAGSGSFGAGPWGVSASARSSISYVSTQKTQATQELNTDLDLNSSVEINFKSDYLPLNRMASPGQTEAIRGNSRNPEAEASAASAERQARLAGARTAEGKRGDSLDTLIKPTGSKPLEPPPAPKIEGEKKDDKPKEKPADKPADKAAEKPAEKPADKPAEKAADKGKTSPPPPSSGGAKKVASK